MVDMSDGAGEEASAAACDPEADLEPTAGDEISQFV